MEDGLRDLQKPYWRGKRPKVLILVLVEDGLRAEIDGNLENVYPYKKS